MGASSSAGQERPYAVRRTIRFTFTAMVAVPAVCLVLLWGLAVSAALGGGRFAPQDHRERAGFALAAGAGLVVILAAAMLMGTFARRLSRDVCDLAATAEQLADEQSPQPAEQLRGGMAAQADGSSRRRHPATTEVARAAAAVGRLQQTATTAAAGEAGLRDGLRQVFVSLARRNQSLLQRQLRLIDALEQKASDPAALADLFSLDHLTTRMRRHAESLAILSGAAPGRSWRDPVPVIDVIRGATAEVEDYKRVAVLVGTEDAVAGPAVADMIHLLAELIENATLFSPSGTRVEVRAGRVANGFAVEIDDRGLGIEPELLSEINQQLASPPDFDLADADRLGLFVGGKLAARHGVRISLRLSPYGGITAIVLMPSSIVVPAQPAAAGPQPDTSLASRRPVELDLTRTGALAFTGQRRVQPSLSAAGQPAAPPHGHAPHGPAPDSPAPDSPGPDSPGPDSPAPHRTGPHRTGPDSPGPDGPARFGQPAAGTHYGLPRRTRQASLSPHLRDGQPAAGPAGPGSRPEPAGARAPEVARDLAASLQSGWQRGRQADLPDAPPPAGTPPAGTPPAGTRAPGTSPAGTRAAGTRAAGRPDSTAPDGEDA
jgi:signal transduction histidine kinase